MKITRLYIKNYKSIKEIDICLSELVNVFIGENSVGKSNIFAAIDWMLGPVFPSFNNFSKEDYYRGDTSLHVVIRVYFDDGHYLELTNYWNYRGYSKSGLNLDGNQFVTDEIRQRYVSALIGADRKVSDNPATNRWTLLGRLLRDINARFMKETVLDPDTLEDISKAELFKKEMERVRNDILFSVKDENGHNLMQWFVSILGEETARQLNRAPDDFNVDLNMYDPWNFYRTLQIIVHEAETGMTFRASELGMGVQASITIAILKAYSKMKLKNQTPILVLILPYLFSLYGYDEVAEGVTIVRCGGKSELDRYYRLYSEFGIPAFIIFDGDYQNVGKDDEDATIAKNRGILRLFNIDDDFPDGAIHENYLGFVYRLEENLGIDGIGNAKALSLFRRVKKEITSLEKVPCWVVEVITAIRKLPAEATSVLAE